MTLLGHQVSYDIVDPNFEKWDYWQATDPLATTNPSHLFMTWMNLSTGEKFACVDNTVDSNKWVGNLGSAVGYDLYWDNVSLLIDAEGTDGSTVITDLSDAEIAFTSYGDIQIDTSQFKHGASSLLLDGTGDYAISTAASTGLDFGSGDFTMEAFIRSDNWLNSYPHIVTLGDGSGNNDCRFFVDNLRNLKGVVYHSSAYQVNITSTEVLAVDTWYHVCFERSGNVHNLYLDGVVVATATVNHTIPTTPSYSCYIGAVDAVTASYRYRGWIDDIRVSKGLARYGGAFTPPTAPHPLGLR